MRKASAVPRQGKVTRIWQDRFPLGALSVLAGLEGSGKSILTCAIAAEGSQSHSVIFCNDEDPAEVSRSRIEAADGKLDRVYIPEGNYLFPRDLSAFEDDVIQTGAKLAIFDPAASFLPSLSHDQTLRKALTPLSVIAEQYKLAIIFVAHTLRSARRGQDIRQTIQGPGLTRAARCLAIFGKRPSLIPGIAAQKNARACSFIKDSYRENPPAVLLHLETVKQGDVEVARMVFDGESTRIDPYDLVLAQETGWRPRGAA